MELSTKHDANANKWSTHNYAKRNTKRSSEPRYRIPADFFLEPDITLERIRLRSQLNMEFGIWEK